jgi:hypothetical protein
MELKNIVARVFTLLGKVPLSLHQLLFRLAIAGVFLRAGLGKVASCSSWASPRARPRCPCSA